MSPQNAESIRVFLVDDHEVVRAGLKSLLSNQSSFTVVGEAGTVDEAQRKIVDAAPDVLLLDLHLPDGSGIDVCREVHNRFPEIRTLILTSLADEDSMMAAASAGASGYLLKRAHADELISAIRKVSGGEDLFDNEVVRAPHVRSEPGPGLSSLSPQEEVVVHLVARGMTNKQIAGEMSLAEKTVRNYVSNALTKLGMTRRAHMAAYVATREVEAERPAIPQSWDETGFTLETV